MKTAFVNAKVYVEAGHFEEAVLIEGNRIAKVGRRADILSSGADEVRDCGGKTLIPGFIDTHGHAYCEYRAWHRLRPPFVLGFQPFRLF